MKILLATTNKRSIKSISEVCRERNYKLQVIDNTLSLYMLISGNVGTNLSLSLFKADYHVIILDKEFLTLLNSISLNVYKEEMSNYPILLIVDEFDHATMRLALSSKVSSMIAKPIKKEELIMRLEMKASAFRFEQQVKQWAFMDPLTQLCNRRTFMNHLERYFKVFQEYQVPFCLCLFDADHFKSINDNYGHSKGDEVLCALSSTMSKNRRKTDILARIGGEEFALICPDTKLDTAHMVAERIRCAIQKIEDSAGLKLSISGGVLESHGIHKTVDDMIREVDILLYQAKELGRNNITR